MLPTTSTCDQVCDVLPKTIKTEMVTNELSKEENERTQSSLLDALRNTYISEKSRLIFCNDVESVCLDQLTRVSLERQTVVEDFVQKFINLSNEEQLLFFLRLPVSADSHQHTPCETKLGILATRVEIQRTAAWIRSHLQVDNDASIPKRDVYDTYIEYCKASRMLPISIADFGKVMKQMYPSVRPRRLGTRGKSQYCYAGMSSCQDVKRPSIFQEQVDSFNKDYVGQTFGRYGDHCGGSDDRQHSMLLEKTFPAESNAGPLTFFQPGYNTNEAINTENNSKCFKISAQNDCDASHGCPEKKCKARKAAICQKSRFKKYVPIQPKLTKNGMQSGLDHITDVQVENEVAQYFQTDNHNFCRPLKVIRPSEVRSSVGIENNFYRSLSYNGGSRDIPSLECRSQSSVGSYGPPWTPYERPASCRHSASSANEGPNTPYRSASREAAERLSKLQLRSGSCVSSNSVATESCSMSGCNPQQQQQQTQCGFTPISPSPVPWRPYSALPDISASHIFAEPDDMNPLLPNFRSRSFSSAEMKWNLKRDFQNAFDRSPACTVGNENQCSVLGENNVWGEQQADVKPPSDGSRSQSLPSFEDKEQNLRINLEQLPNTFAPDNEFENLNNESVAGITCEELNEMLENSMAVESISFGDDGKIDPALLPSGDGLLPQLDNLFNIKHPEDVMVANAFTDKISLENGFSILPQESMNTGTHQAFRSNFDNFF